MQSRNQLVRAAGPSIVAAMLALFGVPGASADEGGTFIPRLVNSSTIPANGDLNPYGVAFVPARFPGGGRIAAGDVLVSNFNDASNEQGRGTTIVELTPDGTVSPPGTAQVFFTSAQPGLDTALEVLHAGLVLVGNVPTQDGTFGTIGQGALQVIDRTGKLLQTLTDPVFLDGPWDLAVADHGSSARVFVANVLNGTVSRLDVAVGPHGLTILHRTTIASGYTHVPNAAALILGPTGLALDPFSDTLYVASTADNTIYAIPQASSRSGSGGPGFSVFSGPQLRGPLALKIAPNGNLLTANGDAVNGDVSHPSEIVEFTKLGQFERQYPVDASQGGAFGLDTVATHVERAFDYAAIDDVTNSVTVMAVPLQ